MGKTFKDSKKRGYDSKFRGNNQFRGNGKQNRQNSNNKSNNGIYSYKPSEDSLNYHENFN